jgi:AraC-like DNA-binding protein
LARRRPHGHRVHTTPDARIDIVLASNDAFDGVFVCGPSRTFSRRRLRGRTRLCVVSLRPGAGALLGISAGDLPRDWVALDSLKIRGAASSRRHGLGDLFALVEARAATTKFETCVEDAIVAMERSRRAIAIGALVRDQGVSERTLNRLFERHAGMSPKAYWRILRFNRALSRLRSHQSEGLAELAFSLGFADQSHMARDLKELGGLTALQIRRLDPSDPI